MRFVSIHLNLAKEGGMRQELIKKSKRAEKEENLLFNRTSLLMYLTDLYDFSQKNPRQSILWSLLKAYWS